jgi:hypothetical protein
MANPFQFILQGAKEESLVENTPVQPKDRATPPDWIAIPEESTEDGNPDIDKPLILDSRTDSETTDLLPQAVIRSEVNFLVLPFFALSRRDAAQRLQTEYRTTIERGNERLDVLWAVSANPRYGYPCPFDGRVHKAIEHIISELTTPLENPIPLGSLLTLAKLMGVGLSKKGKLSGKTYEEIKESLRRITMTGVESRGAFYHKGRKRWLEDAFHLYDRVVFTGEELPSGEIADTNYLFLGNWYLENINARYVKPLDYAYYRSLKSPVASRFYELLGVKFYGMGIHPFIRYRYSNLCLLLPLTRHRYISQAKQKLQLAHQELIRTGFFAKVEWDAIPGEGHDWYVSYWPGQRAKEEIQCLPRQLALIPEGVKEATLDDQSAVVANQLPPRRTSSSASSRTSRKKSAKGKSELTKTQQELVKQMEELGVSRTSAEDLVRQAYPQIISNWIKVIEDDEEIQDRPAYLVSALRENWQLPESFHRKEAERKEAERKEQERKRRESCSICQGQGFYQLAKNTVALCHHNGLEEKTNPKGRELDAGALWTQTLKELQRQVPKPTYESWLKDTRLLGMDGNTAIVEAPSQFTAERLNRLYQSITKALGEVIGQEDVDIEFVVSQETQDRPSRLVGQAHSQG